MAKKPPEENRSSKFVVRLPEEYRDLLDRLVAKSKRSYTAEVQVALDKHAHGEKIAPASQPE